MNATRLNYKSTRSCSLVKISDVTKFFHFESGQGQVLDGNVMEVEPFLKDNISLLQELPNNALLHEVNSRSYKLTTSMNYWEKDPDYSWVGAKRPGTRDCGHVLP